MNIGDRIKYFRTAKGLSQGELAKGICSVSYLSKIENGLKTPKILIVDKLCLKLGIDREGDYLKDITPKLNVWNRHILNKDREKSDEWYKEIRKDIYEITDTQQLTLFQLFKIRYEMTKWNLDLAKSLFTQIMKNKANMNETCLYYYYLLLGHYFHMKKDNHHALENLSHAEEYLSDTLVDEERAFFYLLKAHIYNAMGRPYLCIESSEKASQIYEDIQDYQRCADCHVLIGISLQSVKNYPSSEKAFVKALNLANVLNNNELKGLATHNLGLNASKREQYKEAISFYEKSLKYKELSAPDKKIYTIYTLVEAYYNLNSYLKGLHWIEIGLEIVRNNPEYADLFKEFDYHFRVYGAIMTGKDNTEDFEMLLKKDVIPYFEQIEQYNYVGEYSERLGNYYKNKLRYKQASHYFQIAYQSMKKVAIEK